MKLSFLSWRRSRILGTFKRTFLKLQKLNKSIIKRQQSIDRLVLKLGEESGQLTNLRSENNVSIENIARILNIPAEVSDETNVNEETEEV